MRPQRAKGYLNCWLPNQDWRWRRRAPSQVWGLQAAASCQPQSHRAWTGVIGVMVAMLGVRDLQAGFPLRLFAISRVWLGATRRTFLKEVRHKANLQREVEEEGREAEEVSFRDILATPIGVLPYERYRGGKGWAGNCDYICLAGQVCVQLLSDTHLRGTHREQAQPLQIIKHITQETL